jgi:hypothetical protein
MFNKFVLFSIVALFTTFAHAAKETVDVTSEFNLPESMKGCSIVRLRNDNFVPVLLYVTRCPDAKTETTRSGKNPVHVISNSILDSDSSVELKSPDVLELNGEKYMPLDSLGNFDLSKVVEVNGKKYVKIK